MRKNFFLSTPALLQRDFIIRHMGNECAYTDRIVEEIYEEAEVLRKKHDEYFSSLNTKELEQELIKYTKPIVEALNAEIEKMVQEAKNKSHIKVKN